MEERKRIKTRMGSVCYSILALRHETLKRFFKDFNIDYLKYGKTTTLNDEYQFKDLHLESNFVFFLIENRVFLRFYEDDYYSDKTINEIANRIKKNVDDVKKAINEYFPNKENNTSFKYFSSYALDYKLNSEYYLYKMLRYNSNHDYQGDYEYRRQNYNN
ncbi:hypothetical protein PL373_10615 [Tenacibaculum maritimum]|nr:hypothetical protein [Tenacibaculum maritimum]MDB0601590.1 hypothetical protein [Tenacibaculum maritimum]MDB0612865.1 hypothetical protein [Tenacibaculum maritimum]